MRYMPQNPKHTQTTDTNPNGLNLLFVELCLKNPSIKLATEVVTRSGEGKWHNSGKLSLFLASI